MIDENEHVGVVKRYISLGFQQSEIVMDIPRHSTFSRYDIESFAGPEVPEMPKSIHAIYLPHSAEIVKGKYKFWYEFQGVRIV